MVKTVNLMLAIAHHNLKIKNKKPPCFLQIWNLIQSKMKFEKSRTLSPSPEAEFHPKGEDPH